VAKIRRDTGGVHNIVEGKLVDERTGLEEERERLWDGYTASINCCSFLPEG